jgi:hypothetical protein
MRVGLDSRLRRFLRVVERARVLTHAKQERTNETHKVKQSLGLGLQARHADNAPAAGTDRTAASCWFASGQWTDCLRPSAAGRCAGFSARYSTETGGRRCHAPGGRQQAAGSRQQSSSSRPARRCFSDPGVHRARQNVSVELSLRVSPAPDRPSGPGAGCSQLVAALSLGRMSRPALSRTQDPPSASLSSIRECANSRANNSYGSELRSIKPRHTEEAK